MINLVRWLGAALLVITLGTAVNMANAKALLATSQIDAFREIESARLRMEAAKIAYNRAKQLLEDEAGSQRTVDELVDSGCDLAIVLPLVNRIDKRQEPGRRFENGGGGHLHALQR